MPDPDTPETILREIHSLRADVSELRAEQSAERRLARERVRDVYDHIHRSVDAVREELSRLHSAPTYSPRQKDRAKVVAIVSAIVSAVAIIIAALIEATPRLLRIFGAMAEGGS